MRRLLFAANWKMQVDPAEAREYAARFLGATAGRRADALVLPPAV
jgi:triosephosphate isomerase